MLVASGVISFSAGNAHSLFLKQDGTLWGMGWNESGQLGDGTTVDRSIPVLIARDVLAAKAGGGYTFFSQRAGTGLAPVWATSPAGGAHARGAAVTLSAAATGEGPIDYRWQRNGVDVPGARGATFYLPTLQPADLGTYTVIATNAGGSATSAAAVLNFPPPVIAAAPASGSVVANDRTRLSVAETGAGALTYQWYRGASGDTSNPIAGRRRPRG